MSHTPKSGAAQTQAVMRWSVYLAAETCPFNVPCQPGAVDIVRVRLLVSEEDTGRALEEELWPLASESRHSSSAT